MNPRTSNRKKVQFLVALTLLAWATQTLLHQWAHGEDLPAPTQVSTSQLLPTQSAERFVPTLVRSIGATLELKAEATVTGRSAKLRQVCRWSDADRPFFAPLAELTIAKLPGKAAFESLSIEQVRQTLHDAGVNLAAVRFAGSTRCTITRADVQTEEDSALQQWIDARQGKVSSVPPGETITLPAPKAIPMKPDPARAAPLPMQGAATAPAYRTLRDLITADASVRLKVPEELLQITFNPADEKVLALSEPQFKFNLNARAVFGLGEVEWEAQIITETGSKKINITALARAWQKQVVLVRPVSYRQVIQNADVLEKRVLSDHLPDEPLLTLSQCVGQETSCELKPGTVLSARMVNAVEMAKMGQLVTVTLSTGQIRVKTVGRALEAGSYGQTVKVKNEVTNEVYEVVLTGPQEGSMSPPAEK